MALRFRWVRSLVLLAMASSGLALFVYSDVAGDRLLRVVGFVLVAIAAAASLIWCTPRQ